MFPLEIPWSLSGSRDTHHKNIMIITIMVYGFGDIVIVSGIPGQRGIDLDSVETASGSTEQYK